MSDYYDEKPKIDRDVDDDDDEDYSDEEYLD